MKAILKSYRQAPRKVRLVANLIKGKTVPRALVELEVLPKRASGPIKKLLLSAVANAKENNNIQDINTLLVKEVRVDQGTILKRSLPRAHGSASPIHKHTSHVMLELIVHTQVESEKSKVKSKKGADRPNVARRSVSAKMKASAKLKGGFLKTKD